MVSIAVPVPEVDKDSAVVFVVFFYPEVKLLDLRLVQEPKNVFFQLAAAFAGNNLDERDALVDRFLDYPVQFGFDIFASIEDGVEI